MKRLLSILPAIALTLILCGNAEAAYEPEVDYATEMIAAVMTGNTAAGTIAEQSRNEKIDDLQINAVKFTFQDLTLLSKIIYAEAGSVWLSDEWKMSVGEVALNRVASSEFPNTLRGVLEQPGQYYGKNSRYFNNLLPSERCANVALRLLSGERILAPDVVFQANFKQGSGTHTARYDKHLGWTYFCYSSNRDLYAGEATEASVKEVPQIVEAVQTIEPEPTEPSMDALEDSGLTIS